MGKSFETRHFINGEFVESQGGKTFEVYNPYTEELTAKVSEAQPEDIDAAVEAARKASKSWAATEPWTRAALLNKLADLIDSHADEIAEAEASTMGAPLGFAKQIATMGATLTRYMAALAVTTSHGLTSTSTSANLGYTLKQPFGVVAIVLPWNGPLA
jgi:aldehyde dehydrogenase (NAD+)